MKIKEINNLNLNNYYLKLSKNSITVKNENNKTRKVINDVSNVRELQFNKKVDINNKLKKQGISLMDLLSLIENLYIDKDNNLYCFINQSYIDFINEVKNDDYYKKYNNLCNICNKANVKIITAELI
jgi:hypothetical protein